MVVLVSTASAAAAAGCSRAAVREAPVNVLLVVIDTLRADALGCYGAARPTSPNLDALADRSIVFERSFSTAPWTVPAVASLLTGTYPSLHGHTESQGPQGRLSDDLVTLAEALAAGGHRTAAFSAHPWVSPDFGLGQGFAPSDFHLFAFPGGDPQVTAAVERWLETSGDAVEGRPFFAYVHYMRPHSPYDPTAEAQRRVLGRVAEPPPFSAALARVPRDRSFAFLGESARRGEVTEADLVHLRGLYEAEVRMADDEVGRLLEALRRNGLEDETLVIVTSDHGEAFLENGEVLHGNTLNQEMLHVPLIVHRPAQRGPVRVAHRVQSVDVVPTVLDALGLPVPPQVQGRSRLPGRRRPREDSVFAEAAFGEAARQVRVMRGPFSFIGEPGSQSSARLHDLLEDPLETQDAAARFPRQVERMRREARRFVRRNESRRVALVRTAPAPDPQTLEAVRALGYVR